MSDIVIAIVLSLGILLFVGIFLFILYKFLFELGLKFGFSRLTIYGVILLLMIIAAVGIYMFFSRRGSSSL